MRKLPRRPSIIYFDRASELGCDPEFDGSNLASTIRKSDPTIRIGLLDLTNSIDANQLSQFFEACKKYERRTLQYLDENNVSHAIQGRPTAGTLGKVISATLNGNPVNTSYDRTRVLLPQ